MSWQTELTTRLGIKHPIIQAPMAGGTTTPALVAAVSNAGGLGSIGAGYMAPDDLATAIAETMRMTSKPFAVNLFIPQLMDQSTALHQFHSTALIRFIKNLKAEVTSVDSGSSLINFFETMDESQK